MSSLQQQAANRKAERLDEWAAKRRETANTTLDYNRKHYTSDIAFNTQPGHIPLRARVFQQNDRAYQSLRIAERMERKAKNLRTVRVAGDVERARQAVRESVLAWLTVGAIVQTAHFGIGQVLKINRKTAKMRATGNGTWQANVDLSFLRQAEAICANAR